MALATTVTAVEFFDIVAGVEIAVPIPTYSEDEFIVLYGNAALVAVKNTDYTYVMLGEGDSFTFTVTPTLALLAKIDALIVGDDTEVNRIVVRRELDFTTTATPGFVQSTKFTSREFERIHMKLIQLLERAGRALSLGDSYIGGDVTLKIQEIQANRVLMANDDGTVIIPGPTADEVTNAQGYSVNASTQADAALDAAVLAQKWASEAVDVPVTGGLFSAFHWASVALDIVTNGLIDGFVTTAKLATNALSADVAGRSKMADGYVTPDKISGEIYRGFIDGLNVSLAGADLIGISTGSAGSDGTTPVLMVLGTAITKRLDAAWAVGSGNGGLDTGTVTNAPYHAWLIERSDTRVKDVLLSLSATAPTMPANYDRKRYIGPACCRLSGAVLDFTQHGRGRERKYVYKSPQQTHSAIASMGTTAVTRQLASGGVLVVPSGIKVEASLSVMVANSSTTGENFRIFSMDDTDAAVTPANETHDLQGLAADRDRHVEFVFTDTSGQIRTRCSVGTAVVAMSISVQGWKVYL